MIITKTNINKYYTFVNLSEPCFALYIKIISIISLTQELGLEV